MADIALYDTRRRDKVAFAPADPDNVRMYVCGPTVYDLAHIGNARPAIVFDVLFRLLRWRYGEAHVTYVRNVTDVDDKINARAAERGVPIRTLTDETLARYHEDVASLGTLPPSHEPRATDHIEAMRALIERLVARGHAYVAKDHALFSVGSLASYGSLSHRSTDDMLAGARVDVAPYKRDPMDFVLWKPSRAGEPAWPSPVGIASPGRPGWHIECSAMAAAFLGETFDIHGGGIDLAFPHHENERAQTCAAYGVTEMASLWMHNGFLQVEGRKMAKSEGNFITIADALAAEEGDGDTLRLAMLMTHYRQPIDWTERRLAEARTLMANFAQAASDANATQDPDRAVLDVLADDLNTPAAIARLVELAREDAAALRASAALLGVDPARSEARRAAAAANRRRELPFDVDALVAERLAARRARDYAAADSIRDKLAAAGIVLEDGRDAAGRPVTTWSFAR